MKKLVRGEMEWVLMRYKMGKSEQEEIRKLWDQASKKRDEKIRNETMEWVGSSVRRDLEGIMERRESRMRELVGEDVWRLLEE